MTLPHFDINSFAGQLLWLFISGGITYLFNKIVFIPLISKSIGKRQDLINKYIQETDELNDKIEKLINQIDILSKKTHFESKQIIESALNESQEKLLEHVKRNNHLFIDKTKDCDKYMADQKEKLASNIDCVIEEMKDKVVLFISRRNFL